MRMQYNGSTKQWIVRERIQGLEKELIRRFDSWDKAIHYILKVEEMLERRDRGATA